MAKWLMKSEPSTYSWSDLSRDGSTWWDGVRNNGARLHLRAMNPGDEALFYHSGDERAAVGIMRIGTSAADGDDAQWVKVEVEPVRALAKHVSLAAIKSDPSLAEMALVKQSRLSVSPVTDAEWERVLALADA